MDFCGKESHIAPFLYVLDGSWTGHKVLQTLAAEHAQKTSQNNEYWITAALKGQFNLIRMKHSGMTFLDGDLPLTAEMTAIRDNKSWVKRPENKDGSQRRDLSEPLSLRFSYRKKALQRYLDRKRGSAQENDQ